MSKKKRGSPVYRAVLLCTVFIFSGCVSHIAASGGAQKRMAVEELFDSGTIVPDHSYYTDGPENDPVAIIALSNAYQLRSELWSQREMTTEKLSKAAFWMRVDEVGFCTTSGGVLLAPDGKEIGFWFSKRDATIIREPEPGVVEIYPFSYAGSSACARQELRDKL